VSTPAKRKERASNIPIAAATPRVSIIIPSWSGDVSRAMRSIEQQTFQNYEVTVVQEPGLNHARNLGAVRSRGEILVLIDDDITLGHERVLETMVDLLESESHIGIVGVSLQVPVQSNRFQHAVARQVPRYVDPILSEHALSNPPLHRHGFTAVKGGCCAIRRTIFEEVGGFDESALRGEDTDFFYRARRRGHDLALAANAWAYHPPPARVSELLRKSFSYGVGHALEARKSPERGMAMLPLDRWYGVLGLLAAVMSFPLAWFIHYYFDPVRRVVVSFRPLKTLSSYATLCGYVYGWYHARPAQAITLA
jgi:cellulose synthase/poly-beta-1,6-N-acetylglucosamine synthase-like glycosyltransferase